MEVPEEEEEKHTHSAVMGIVQRANAADTETIIEPKKSERMVPFFSFFFLYAYRQAFC